MQIRIYAFPVLKHFKVSCLFDIEFLCVKFYVTGQVLLSSLFHLINTWSLLK